jgi:hypothetical protein
MPGGNPVKHTLVFVAALLLLGPITSAGARKPHEQTFTGTQEQVFQAALTAARQNYVIQFVDEKQHLITFEQGGGAFHGEIIFNAVVGPEKDGQVTVSLNYQGKRGTPHGGNLAGNYFKRVDEALKAASTVSK